VPISDKRSEVPAKAYQQVDGTDTAGEKAGHQEPGDGTSQAADEQWIEDGRIEAGNGDKGEEYLHPPYRLPMVGGKGKVGFAPADVGMGSI
jgi:hypothetical protein